MKLLTLFLIYGTTFAALIVLGSTILLGKKLDVAKKVFAIVCFLFAAWTFFLFLTDLSSDSSSRLVLLRCAILIGNFIPLLFAIFCIKFSENKLVEVLRKSSMILAVGVAMALVLTAVTFSNLMVASVSPALGAQPGEIGIAYRLQAAYSIVFFAIGFGYLHFGTKKNPVKHNQARFIIYGLGLSMIVNFVTSLVLVELGVGENSGLIGPPTVLLLVISTYFAIARHRVFDVRPYLTRATSSIISVGLMLTAIVAINQYILILLPESSIRRIISGMVLAGTLISYHKTSSIFFHLTNRLFFRAYYDPATALTEAAALLSYEHSVDKLSSDTVDFIRKLLSVDGAMIAIKRGAYSPEQIVKSGLKANIKTDRSQLIEMTSKRKEWINHEEIIASHPELSYLETIIPLWAAGEYQGTLGIGLKKSGTPFDDKDYSFLGIFSKNLSLAIQNARRHNELQNFANKLKHEVDKATSSLRIANKEILDISSAKDEFISMASHQLRPQLAASQGFIELLQQRENLSKKDREEFLQLTRLSVMRMVRLVADMLNASKIQAGKLDLIFDVQDLAKLVYLEIENTQLSAKNAGVELVSHLPSRSVMVRADETKLREVIFNLIDNAIRYTDRDTQVAISVVQRANSVEFKVVDRGIGVAEVDKHRLFSKFYRADNAIAARPSGTGIGLFVAKKVIEAHDGKIIFESMLGKGSTFGFSLPKA